MCVSDKRVPRCRVLRSLSDRHQRGKSLKGWMEPIGQCPRFFFFWWWGVALLVVRIISFFVFFLIWNFVLFTFVNCVNACEDCAVQYRENNRRSIWHVTWRIALLVSWWSQNKIRIQEEMLLGDGSTYFHYCMGRLCFVWTSDPAPVHSQRPYIQLRSS